MGFQDRIKPKRSLGQNFLTNQNLVKKITAIVLDSKPDHITEIGPGKGAFTKLFYEYTTALTLVEKDFLLSQFLEDKFPEAVVYNLDFIDYELTNCNTTYFGSLPFNMHSQIIKRVISSRTFCNPAYFIIQNEVARKYLNSDINPLGLIREIYSDFEIIFDIKPGNFHPRPNVVSSFVRFKPKQIKDDIDIKNFELLITRSFTAPRKTLRNNLKSYNYNLPDRLMMKRPNKLGLNDYISILKHS